MAEPNPFLPEVTAFALTLHATRDELVAIAQEWADRHSLYVAVERPIRFSATLGRRPLPTLAFGAALASVVVGVSTWSLDRHGLVF